MIHLTAYEPNAPLAPEGKFSLGRTVATPGALAAVPAEEMKAALFRHHHGDWGDVNEDDRLENERSLQQGFRLVSVFHSEAGVKFYIITEHDRFATTVLLPEEY